MSEEKKPNTIITSALDEEAIRNWLAGGDAASPLDQWIFWNNSPSRHVPLATLTQFFPEKFYQVLLKNIQVRSQVDAILRSKLSWSAPVAWRPQDSLWEISLAAPARLQRLAFLAAALSMKEVLAKIIDGAVVRKLRQEIGEDIIEFVLLSGSLSKYSFATWTIDPPIDDELVTTLQQKAFSFINNAFSTKEIGVQQRIATKIPGSFSNGPQKTPSPFAQQAQELLCKLWKENSSWL
jgi:hypothetical protein